MLHAVFPVALLVLSSVNPNVNQAASTQYFDEYGHVNRHQFHKHQSQRHNKNNNNHNGDSNSSASKHDRVSSSNTNIEEDNINLFEQQHGEHHSIFHNGNMMNDRLIQLIDIVSEPGGTGISAYKSSDSDDRIEIPDDWEVEITARMPISVAEHSNSNSKGQNDDEFVFGASFVQHSLKPKNTKRLTMPSKIMVPLQPKRFDKYLLDPCFKNKYLHEKDTTFFLPNVKADKKYGNPQCMTYDTRQKAFEINRINAPNFEQQSKPVIFKIDQPEYYYWSATEMEAASKYCQRHGCPDRDPLVFYNDQYVGFWHGWADNWFQGYKITPDTLYIKKSDNPIGAIASNVNNNNEFNFLQYKGYKWASAEHFIEWTRDEILLNGAHSDDLLLEHPQKQITFDKDSKTNTSPRQAFYKSRDWINQVLPSQSDPRRQAWYNCEFLVQVKALWLKFTQNDALKLKLLGTSNRQIFHASPFDDRYGIYPARSIEQSGLIDALRANDEKYFVGEFGNKPTNILGRALMVTRELIKLSNKLGKSKITFDDLKVETMNHILFNATTHFGENYVNNGYAMYGNNNNHNMQYNNHNGYGYNGNGVNTPNGINYNNMDGMMRVLMTLQYADLDKCQPIIADKQLSWLELDTFEMPNYHNNNNNNNNHNNDYYYYNNEAQYHDGGYHSEL